MVGTCVEYAMVVGARPKLYGSNCSRMVALSELAHCLIIGFVCKTLTLKWQRF